MSSRSPGNTSIHLHCKSIKFERKKRPGYKQCVSKGDKASPDYFTGVAWVKTLVADDDTLTTIISNVVFEAGARNNWHTHPAGQVLICTDGVGYYQERGKPIQILHAGDVVKIQPDLEHWHGVSPDQSFTHIAINVNTEKGIVNWLQPVTEQEYSSK